MPDELTLALDHHQRGYLTQAAERYHAILTHNPNHADAAHLLGVVALQQGDGQQAVAFINRALALRPGEANFHANLAEAYRALGLLDRAIGCCRLALRLRPDCAEAANHLGLALLDQRKPDAAALAFRDALRLRPDFAMIQNNLGTALRQQGDKEQAASHFHRAVELDPNLAEAHSNLGQLLLEQKDLDLALHHCGEAARLRPNLAEAHNNLGNVLRELGRLTEAKASYTEALRLNPHLAMAYNNLGQAVQQEGQSGDALTWYQQALQLDANSPRIHCNAASALAELEAHAEARAHYEHALRLDPNSAEAHNGLGELHREQGDYEAAKTHYREAIHLQSGLASAHVNLGNLLQELSDFAEAQACFRTALQHDSTHAGAMGQLATMLRTSLPDADRTAMLRLLAAPHATDGQRMALHYGLAQVLDAEENYAAAADHLRQANALCQAGWRKRGQEYDPTVHADFVAAMIATTTPEFFARTAGFGVETTRPIFIVGLPRSGTTLIEQILASHSQVFGAGELPFAGESLASLPVVMNRDTRPVHCLAEIDRETTRQVAERHLDRLRERNDTARHVVDKMPDNYLHVGLIHVLFPNATIIHCRRDLRDVAVSCWMTHFRQIRWSCDPEAIAVRFREYRRVMEHWRQVLPVPLHEVHYEETVTDLEGVAQRLLAACGLEWEPACLAFHQTRRPVRTASVRQVRQPIYTRSMGRWKHYENDLKTLLDKLPAQGQ